MKLDEIAEICFSALNAKVKAAQPFKTEDIEQSKKLFDSLSAEDREKFDENLKGRMHALCLNYLDTKEKIIVEEANEMDEPEKAEQAAQRLLALSDARKQASALFGVVPPEAFMEEFGGEFLKAIDGPQLVREFQAMANEVERVQENPRSTSSP